MHETQRERTDQMLRSKGIEQALFTNYCSVKWLTGFAPPVQTGPYLFAGGPALVWYADGHYTLLVVDALSAAAPGFGEQPDCALVSYQGYSLHDPITPVVHLTAAFRGILRAAGPVTGPIALEENDTPLSLVRLLEEAGTSSVLVPSDGWLEPLRMVKTDEEIEKLRANFALTGVGHAAARAATETGMREIDVWNVAHSAMQAVAGQRVPAGEDVVVNYRENNIAGWPLDHAIQPGGSLIVDLAPMFRGYWGDSCGTYYPGTPTAEQAKAHETVRAALYFAAGLLRPGVVAREFDASLRQFLVDAGYPPQPHHSGHGIGVSVHEAPRLVPNNEQALQEGMVLMVEPGIYVPGKLAVRLEDAFLITSDGAERLTHHDKTLPQQQ